MINLVDKIVDGKEIWGWVGPDADHITYEDETVVPVTTNLITLDFWKFKGELLSNVADIGALQFMVKVAKERDLQFAVKVLEMRLKEL